MKWLDRGDRVQSYDSQSLDLSSVGEESIGLDFCCPLSPDKSEDSVIDVVSMNRRGDKSRDTDRARLIDNRARSMLSDDTRGKVPSSKSIVEDSHEINLEAHQKVSDQLSDQLSDIDDQTFEDTVQEEETESLPPPQRKKLYCCLLLFVICLCALFLGLYFGVWRKDQRDASLLDKSSLESGDISDPLSDAEQYILNILDVHTSSVILLDPNTPQGQAYAYLVAVEGNATEPTSSFDVVQRYALLTLFHSTDGENWTINFGWNTAWTNTCSWYGISTCRNSPDGLGASNLGLCKSFLNVSCPVLAHWRIFSNKVVLGSASNGLNGILTDEICLLGHTLESFDLSNNNLSGPIPSCIVEYRNLENLHLEKNKFTGDLPIGLLTIPTLIQVDLSENQLTGPMDVLFQTQSAFSSEETSANTLSTFSVAGNQLTGVVPSAFSEFAASLDFSANNLTGTLDAAICAVSVVEVDCTAITCTCCTGCS